MDDFTAEAEGGRLLGDSGSDRGYQTPHWAMRDYLKKSGGAWTA